MSHISISARDLTVEFPIYNASHRSLRKTVLKATTGGILKSDSTSNISIRAIDGASFTFTPGDRVGIIGHNGAGKSTLLRTLAGVYYPTAGSLQVRGKVTSLLDIALGLESESTGYENITLRGILLGLSRPEIENNIEKIADFSDLGDYLNMPLRTYSSGMLLRLAFAISTCVHTDILLMDEWLSVGDNDFNRKATEKLHQMINSSSILVLASHSTDLLKDTCNRFFKAEHGRFEEIALGTL